MRQLILVLSPLLLIGCGPAGIGAAVSSGSGNGGADVAALDITVTSGPPPATNETTATFLFTSNRLNTTFEGRYDGGNIGEIESPFTINNVVRGTHEFVLTASVGNETRTQRWTWTMDPDPPVTTFADAPAAFSPMDSATFELRADQGSSFAARLDGVGDLVAVPGTTVTLAALSEGEHELEVQATDPAGNVEFPTTRYTWMVDTLPPQAPTGLTPTPGGARSLALVWPEGVDTGVVPSGIASSRISYGFDASYAGTDADQGPSPIDVDGNLTTLTLTGLQSCQDYFLRLEILDRAGNVSATSFDLAQRSGCGSTGSFEPPVFFAVGDGPIDVQPLDIDADGRLDLAVLHEGSRDAYLMRNLGSGQFELAASSGPIEAEGTPVALEIADVYGEDEFGFGGDGVLDLIVGCFRTDSDQATVSLIVGGESGGLWRGTLVESSRSPSRGIERMRGLHLVDQDEDGTVEVVFYVGDGLGAALPGRGLEESFANICFPSTGQFSASALIDLDGQLLPDLVGTLPSGRVAALVDRGFAQGRYNYCGSVFSVTGIPDAIATGDFDGDGSPDVVASIPGARGVDVLRNLGSGILDLPKSYAVAGVPQALLTGDVDDDAILDLIVSQDDGNLALREGTGSAARGDGAFDRLTVLPGGIGAGRIRLADLDGDGVRDLVFVDTPGDRIGVLFGQGTVKRWDGTFATGAVFGANVAPEELLAFDYDDDRIADVVMINRPAWTVTTQRGLGQDARGTGRLDRPVITPIGIENGTVGSIAMGDLNGDRIVDLVVTYSEDLGVDESRMRILFGNGEDGRGDGSFRSEGQPITTGNSSDPGVFGVADYNGDGLLDMIEATFKGLLWLQSFDGTFDTGIASPLPGSVEHLASADFDGDGLLDTVVTTGSLASLLLTPPSVLGDELIPTGPVDTPASIVDLETRDFDGDGVPDLALLGAPGLQIALGASTGPGDITFPALQTFAMVAPEVHSFASADLDEDGDLDYVISHGGDPALGFSLVLGNGDGTFAPAQAVASLPGHTPGSIAITDTDRDGVLDLMVGDPDGASIVIYRGNGTIR